MDGREGYHNPTMPVPSTPAGLEAIYKACRRLYPNQPNPLQVTAMVKYWLGGPDPLDYISMYANPGDPTHNVPAHWHYVSFGLSDLHGDGRVHGRSSRAADGTSGFGFELTLRLRREEGETGPPTWPAALMQALARYVFQSENNLCAGDHVSWHQPLDGSESRIQHMLMMDDAQLHPINTAFGTVNFVQVVGVCCEELKAAQHWNGPGVIQLLKQQPVAGGSWLITDMRRGETIFDVDPHLQDTVDRGIEEEGSNLSGVSGRCSWEDSSSLYGDGEEEDKENRLHYPHRRSSTRSTDSESKPHISPNETEQIKATLKKGLSFNSKPVLPPIKSEHQDYRDPNTVCQRNERKPSVDSEGPSELLNTRFIESVHLKFNFEAGSLLPLALRGRLRHGRHFTYKSVLNDVAITLVSTSVVGSIADEYHPYAAHGPWLQVLFTDDFIDCLLEELSDLSSIDEITEPLLYHWPEKKLTITIIPDDVV